MITSAILLDFLHCKRKAFLKAVGASGQQTEFEKVQRDLDQIYEGQATDTFLSTFDECEVVWDPPSLAGAMKDRPRIIVNATIDSATGYATSETGPRWSQRMPVAITRWQTLLAKWGMALVLVPVLVALTILARAWWAPLDV